MITFIIYFRIKIVDFFAMIVNKKKKKKNRRFHSVKSRGSNDVIAVSDQPPHHVGVRTEHVREVRRDAICMRRASREWFIPSFSYRRFVPKLGPN